MSDKGTHLHQHDHRHGDCLAAHPQADTPGLLVVGAGPVGLPTCAQPGEVRPRRCCLLPRPVIRHDDPRASVALSNRQPVQATFRRFAKPRCRRSCRTRLLAVISPHEENGRSATRLLPRRGLRDTQTGGHCRIDSCDSLRRPVFLTSCVPNVRATLMVYGFGTISLFPFLTSLRILGPGLESCIQSSKGRWPF
jgi:hypothetical protein